ncbi:hypothetical protein JCM3766R1_001240 [Sporobolomyces carnicolor]
MSPLFTNPFSTGSPSIPPSVAPLPLPTSIPSLRRTSLVRAASPSPNHEALPPRACPLKGSGSGAGAGGSEGAAGSSSTSGSGTQVHHSSSGISFISPFAAPGKRVSISQASTTPTPRRRKSQSETTPPARSTSQNRRTSRVNDLPASPRSSNPASPATPIRSPSVSSASSASFFAGYLAPSTPQASTSFLANNVDFTRRRSVDVGVLGVGTHRMHGVTAMSKRKRDAVGPDAGDKETGLIGAGKKGGRDRLLGRHLASLLAHSLALCAEPKAVQFGDQDATERAPAAAGVPLEAIPASPTISLSPTQTVSTTFFADSTAPSSATSPISPFECDESLAAAPDAPPTLTAHPPLPTFPVLSTDDRSRLISGLQSWSFNAMSYSADELLAGVGLIFESVRSMEGVEFDLGRMKSLLMSLRSVYHSRNGYHNFSHATDVTQACYTFLVRMGLAPPLHLLCEDDFDPNTGEARRKWRRNRAVDEGRMGKLLRPMDVFALIVSCIGHDVGHPGLSNAYLVNARAPIAQVYTDKSILENFHNVTLIHMLRKHQFDYLLGGDFGHSGDSATSFRKIVEASILATDMSRHFEFVRELSELGKSFATKDGTRDRDLEADRLLLCAGLIKSADISNPSRPHRISRVWSAALLEEWSVQAKIEAEFNLPITVMVQDASDNKALAKGQMGFIDLFCKPLFTAMASCVDEFHDFSEKLRDGRAAWETISLQTDMAFSQPAPENFRLSPAPPPRRSASSSSLNSTKSNASSTQGSTTTSADVTPVTLTPVPSTKPINLPAEPSFRSRPLPLRAVSQRHGRHASNASVASSTKSSPLSPGFLGSPSSANTAVTSFSQLSALSQNNGRATTDLTGLSSYSRDNFLSTSGGLTNSLLSRGACGGACQATTALCVICAAAQRRGSLPTNSLADSDASSEEDDDDELDFVEEREHPDLWPPYPFQWVLLV